MRKLLATLFLALAANIPAVVQGQPTPEKTSANVYGTWVNPHGTLRVQADTCGNLLCGRVVAASAYQQESAQKAGVTNLLGKNLLEDFKQTSPTSWEGRVFVPERGGSYFSRIKQLGVNELRISGCILGGMICKSEIWRRG